MESLLYYWDLYFGYLTQNGEINFSVLGVDALENIKAVAGLHKGAFVDNLQFYVPLLIIFTIAIFATDSFRVFEPLEGLSETFTKISMLKVIVFGATCFSLHAFYKIIASGLGTLFSAHASVESLFCIGTYFNPIVLMVYAVAISTLSLNRADGSLQAAAIGAVIFVSPTILSFTEFSTESVTIIVAGIILSIMGGILYKSPGFGVSDISIVDNYIKLSILYLIEKAIIIARAETVVVLTGETQLERLKQLGACMEMDLILIIILSAVLLIYDQCARDREIKKSISVFVWIGIFTVLAVGAGFLNANTEVAADGNYKKTVTIEPLDFPAGEVIDLADYEPNDSYNYLIGGYDNDFAELYRSYSVSNQMYILDETNHDVFLALNQGNRPRTHAFDYWKEDYDKVPDFAAARYSFDEEYYALYMKWKPIVGDDSQANFLDVFDSETGESLFHTDSYNDYYGSFDAPSAIIDISGHRSIDIIASVGHEGDDKRSTAPQGFVFYDLRLFPNEETLYDYIAVDDEVTEEIVYQNQYVITAGSANIREGAGTEYNVITVANEGDTFFGTGNETVNSETGSTWYEIYLDEEQTTTGWASEKVIERIYPEGSIYAQISDDQMSAMINKGVELFYAYTESRWQPGFEINSVDCVSSYLFIGKEDQQISALDLLYKINFLEIDNNVYEFYYRVRFDTTYASESGDIIFDLDYYTLTDHTFRYANDEYYTEGYESVESYYEAEVEPNLEYYDCDARYY